MPRKPVIALDADGVLVDFHHGYADAWRRAFGARPAERDPLAYWPMDRWHVERLEGEALRHFGRHFDEHFWLTLPPLPGAVEACHRLHDAGFDIVCVSALDVPWEGTRLRNLRHLGFPIERVIAPDAVHRALVLRAPNGSPNDGPELSLAHTTHDDLADFVEHWLARR